MDELSAAPTARPLVVAAVQTGPVSGNDPEEMLPAAAAALAQAAQARADIVCFPELFAAPFFPNRLDAGFDRYFVNLDGRWMQRARTLVREAGMPTILPFAERSGEGYFNSAAVLSGDGRLLGVYRKTHIPAYFPTGQPGGTGSYEKFYFAPGRELPVFRVRGLTFGIQICNDRLYPEPSRVLALEGAQCIFMPICYSTYGDPGYRDGLWELPLRMRAFENGVFVVAANRVGVEGERHHLGRSMVVDPRGQVLAEASRSSAELLVTTIDLAAVTEARSRFPWWRDRRADLYGPIAQAGPVVAEPGADEH